LYGTTYSGGTTGNGTVFSITGTGKETVLYSFGGGADGANPEAGLIKVGDTLYGTTAHGGGSTSRCYGSTEGCGTVFSITTSGAEKVLHGFGGGSDGFFPEAGVINVNGTLYGTTYYGGVRCGGLGCGTVFALPLSQRSRIEPNVVRVGVPSRRAVAVMRSSRISFNDPIGTRA
jgi:uncharacterized repeat protein (TIGR03803 family)